jgi:hypothetical protein
MYNPFGSEHHNEFVEIVNIGIDTVSLDGWRIGDNTDTDQIVDAGNGLQLEPAQYGVILDPDYFADPVAYRSIPSTCLVASLDGATFGHSGFSNSTAETVRLIDPSGFEVAVYTYEPDNESGYSDEKIDIRNEDSARNWADCIRYGGTPGFQNSVSREAHEGNGWLRADPNPFSPDGDGYQEEVRIQYHLPLERGWVSCRIFDSRGRMIMVLAGAEQSGAGGFFIWDGTGDSGMPVPAGIYIIFLEGLNDSAGLKAQLKGTVVVARR